MSDLDASYIENRAAQNMSNMGELENASPQMEFENNAIEEVDGGGFQRVGRNPNQGVAAKIADAKPVDVRQLDEGGYGAWVDGAMIAGGSTKEDAFLAAQETSPNGAELFDPAAQEAQQPTEEDVRSTVDIAKDLGLGALSGPNEAINEISKVTGIDEIASWLDENVADLSFEFEKPDSTAFNLAEVTTQTAAGIIPYAKMLKGVGIAGNFLRWTAADLLTEGTVFAADEQNLAEIPYNQLADYVETDVSGELADMMRTVDDATASDFRDNLVELLSKEQEDPEGLKRLKNAFANSIPGPVIDFMVASYKGSRKLLKLIKGTMDKSTETLFRNEQIKAVEPNLSRRGFLKGIGTAAVGVTTISAGLGGKIVSDISKVAPATTKLAKATGVSKFNIAKAIDALDGQLDLANDIWNNLSDNIIDDLLSNNSVDDLIELTNKADQDIFYNMVGEVDELDLKEEIRDVITERLLDGDLDVFDLLDDPTIQFTNRTEAEKFYNADKTIRNVGNEHEKLTNQIKEIGNDIVSDGEILDLSKKLSKKLPKGFALKPGKSGAKAVQQLTLNGNDVTLVVDNKLDTAFKHILNRARSALVSRGAPDNLIRRIIDEPDFSARLLSSIDNTGTYDKQLDEFLKKEGFDVSKVPVLPIAPAAIAVSTAFDTTQEDQSQDTQVASAASKFLQEIIGTAVSKEARVGKKILEGNYTEFADDVVVEGTDFNFERMNTSDDLKNQINSVSFVYEDTIDAAKKGVVPHDVTRDLAELLGQDMDAAEAAVKSLPGDVEDLHVRALTMRRLLVSSAEKTDDLARVISQGGKDVSDGDYLRFREQIVRHAQLQAEMKGVQSEIGRALSAFRIPSEAYERNPQIAGELVDSLGGRETAQEIADRWLKTPVDRRPDFTARSAFARTKDAVYEVWINGLLSGLRTHQVNTVGNTVFTMFQIPERAIAAGVGAIGRNSDRVRFQEVYAMARGSAEGMVDGIRLAWKTWKDEMPQDGISKIEAQQMKAITPENFNVDPDSLGGKAIDYIGQGVRLPGRALMTADEFYKAVGYRSELRAVSMRKMLRARDEGLMTDLIADVGQTAKAEDGAALTRLRKVSEERNLNGEELSEFMDIMLENPTKELDMAAHDYATYITFQSELGEAGKGIQHAASRVPGGRVIIPFIRTPTNIIKEFARRSPLAAAMPSTYKALRQGGPARDLAVARLGVGTSLMTWAYFMATDGNITGGGPDKSSKTYAQWRETHEPYSMKIDGKWVPYGRIEPLAMLFGSTADAVDFIQYSDDEDANAKVYAAALAGVMQNIGSKTFLRGISDVSDAFTDPTRYAESYVANMARTIIPFSSMVRDITRANDPIMRETRVFGSNKGDNPINVSLQRILNEMKAATPGFSNDLPPKRNFWGEERRAYEGGPATAFNAFSTKTIKKSPIDDEMVRLNSPLRMPSRTVGQYELNPEQYDRLVVLMNKTPEGMASIDLALKYGNKTMRQALNNLVKSDLWAQVQSDDVKIHYLQKIRNDYIDAAKQALSIEDGAVSDAKLQEDADKMMLQNEQDIIKPLVPMSTQIGVN